MLTGRQKKYWMIIFSLLGQGSASYEERSPLFLVENAINSGKNFGNVMRKLIIELEVIEQSQGGKLTSKVKDLLNDIKRDYGNYMLTDRQSKFYNRIQLCLLSESKASDEERKYLTISKNKLDSGIEFKIVINSLNLALSALDYGRLQKGGLTPEVKVLFEGLKSIYGEPVNQDIYAEKLASVVNRNNGIVQYTKGPIILTLILVIILTVIMIVSK